MSLNLILRNGYMKNVFKNLLAHKIWHKTVIPIIVLVLLSKMTRCLHRFIVIYCLLLFDVGVLRNAYPVLTQTRLFSHDVSKQMGRSFAFYQGLHCLQKNSFRFSSVVSHLHLGLTHCFAFLSFWCSTCLIPLILLYCSMTPANSTQEWLCI